MALVAKTTRDASGAEFSIWFDDAIATAFTPISLLYGPIPAGTNVIGGVTQSGTWNVGITGTADVNIVSGSVTAVFTGSLPAGDNNIGNVDVVTLPSLPAGTNNIGDVDVLSLPALPAGTNNIGDVDVLTVPTTATTTREYSLSNAIRVAFTSTSTTEAALPTLGASREVRLCASQRCWIKWGTTGLSAAAAEAASFPVEANSPEVIRIPSGATHYRVIRDTADGNLHMAPVA